MNSERGLPPGFVVPASTLVTVLGEDARVIEFLIPQPTDHGAIATAIGFAIAAAWEVDVDTLSIAFSDGGGGG